MNHPNAIDPRPTSTTARKRAKDKPSEAFRLVFPVVCALLGSAITGAFTWVAGYQAASMGKRTACIQRIDEREKLLRSKGEVFLGAMGDFMNYTIFPQTDTSAELAQRAGPLIRAGFVIVAYSQGELALRSLKVVQSVRAGALASMGEADEASAIATLQDSFGKWPNAYQGALDELDRDRAACGAP